MKGYFINVKDIDFEENKEFLLSLVDERKREKALRFKRSEDRVRTLVGDILVRVVLCRDFNYKNEDIEYGYNEFNKPFLKGNPKIHFNISHSKDYVAAAFDDEEIGIDVEEIKEMEYEDIVKRFFTDYEYKWIMEQEEGIRLQCFYKLWTLKESYVKFKGKGMNISFDSFKFHIDCKNNICELADNDEPVFFMNHSIDNSYELSLCGLKEEMKIEEITYEELVECTAKIR